MRYLTPNNRLATLDEASTGIPLEFSGISTIIAKIFLELLNADNLPNYFYQQFDFLKLFKTF